MPNQKRPCDTSPSEDNEGHKRLHTDNVFQRSSADVPVVNMSGEIKSQTQNNGLLSQPGYCMGISSTAQELMRNMGYQEGKGLGKLEQGIVKPIEASNHRGTRGLGLNLPGLEPKSDLTWDVEKDSIDIVNPVCFINSNPDVLITDTIDTTGWIQCEQKNVTKVENSIFCEDSVFEKLLHCKNVFDQLAGKELVSARCRANPFEAVGKTIFQNRAGMKMANIDADCGFMFSNPVEPNTKHSIVGHNEPLYFADVCAAPGGFSEYLIWRRHYESPEFFQGVKGFGFTLKSNDFKLHDFYAGPPHYLEPHYGAGDGDIFRTANIESFRRFVLDSTLGVGVHVVMADGGFSVEGQENLQEILSKQLYLCQFAMALGIVRTKGHFVCKVFDLFQPFSAGLLYILHSCFEEVAIHKPHASRPANSERYVIAKWKKSGCEAVYEYLLKVNDQLNEIKDSDTDIVHLIPLQLMERDKEFINYMVQSNGRIGEKQIAALDKVRLFCQDPNLTDPRQGQFKKDCLLAWGIPDRCRVAPTKMRADEKALLLADPYHIEDFSRPNLEVSVNSVEGIHSPYDYRFVVVGCGSNEHSCERGFFISQGSHKVQVWNGIGVPIWRSAPSNISLPTDTLVYGEIVKHHTAKSTVPYLHLIDGVVLSGIKIYHLHMSERHKCLQKFAASINKPFRTSVMQVRVKCLYRFEDIKDILHSDRLRVVNETRYFIEEEESPFSERVKYIPQGILVLKMTKPPWTLAFSKTQQKKYFYNIQTKESDFLTRPECIASFLNSRAFSFFWWWRPGVQVLNSDRADPDKVHLETIVHQIARYR